MALNNLNFFSQIKTFNYFEKNANFAVGVSGGVDSITLVYLLSKWAKINRYNIVALIVDHRLRPNSSMEAKNVSLYLSNLKIKNKILVLKSKNNKTRIQQNARLARIKIIKKYCYQNNIIHLFLGHHLDDSLETFVLRKVAGSDIEGLNSIKFITLNEKILIIRPLLNFSRNEIMGYAKKNGLNWIEDPSNTKILFSRTKIRLAISKNDKIRNNIKNELDICQNIYKDYVEMINFILCKVIIFISDKYIEIDKKLFFQLPKEIAYKILVISVIYVQEGNIRFKHNKLVAIYDYLAKKFGYFQTQKTLFANTINSISISKVNNFD